MFQLCQQIYRRSNWLKFVTSYLDGNSIEDIVNNNYISIASGYRYKKQLDEYLKMIGKENALSHTVEHENIYRMVKSFILFLTGEPLRFVDTTMHNDYSKKIHHFITDTCQDLQRHYLPESWEYLEIALFIAITELEKGYSLAMPARLKKDMKHFPLSEIVAKNLKKQGLQAIIDGEDEITAIALLFIQLPYVTTTIDTFELAFTKINLFYLENVPEYKNLVEKFQLEFGKSSIDTLLFYKSLIVFIDTMTLDYQELLPENEEFSDSSDYIIKNKITKIIKNWIRQCSHQHYHFREKSIDTLANRLALLIKNKPDYIIRVVASSDFEYQAIKQFLLTYESVCNFSLDPLTYFNLSAVLELPAVDNELVLCTKNHFFSNNRKTIAVNLKSIHADILRGLQDYHLI